MPRMDSTTYLETKAFEKMDKLRLLQLSGLQLNGDYKYLSRDLRWLSWHGFPLKCTPADFHQGSLVSIELKYSNLERVWRKSQLLEKLKMLNLSHSHNLRYTPDFSNLPNLEKLILKDCPSLSSVSPNIGYLRKILLIDLKDCTGLRKLPRSIYKLDSVKTLILSGCTNIDKLEEDIEQMKSLTILAVDAITRVPYSIVRLKEIGYISLCGHEGFPHVVFPSIIQSWLSPRNNISPLVQASSGTSCLSSTFEELQNLQRLWLTCDSEAQLNQMVTCILDSFKPQNFGGSSNIATSASIQSHSQVCISSSKKSLTFLLIEMGMSRNVANILRENILQEMPPIGSGILPGDNYPNWLTFSSNGSSVTFIVPQVDGRNLKTITCLVYSYSPDSTTKEGLKVVLVINCTKNTIHVYKRDASLASHDEEWQRVISNIEPGNEIKVVVVFTNEFIVKKMTVYLVYEPDDNIFGRLLIASESLMEHDPYERFVKNKDSSSSKLLQDSIKSASKDSSASAASGFYQYEKEAKKLKVPAKEPSSEPETTPSVVFSEPSASKAHSKSSEPNQNHPPNSPMDIDSPIQTPSAEPEPLYHTIPLPKHNPVFLQHLPNTVDHDLYWHIVYAGIKEEYRAERLAWNRNDEYYERVLHLLLELQEANEKLVNRRYMKRIMAKMNKKQEKINNRIIFETKWKKVPPLVENFIKEQEEKAKMTYITPFVEDYGNAVPYALQPRLVDCDASSSTSQYVTRDELHGLEERIQARMAENQASIQAMFLELMKFIKKP